MRPGSVINYFGGLKETAKALRISETAVKHWLRPGGQVGWIAQQLIEHISIGLLKANRPKRKKRPQEIE